MNKKQDGRKNNGGHKTAGAKRKPDTEKKETFNARADGVVRDFFNAQNTSRSDTLRMLVDFYKNYQRPQSD